MSHVKAPIDTHLVITSGAGVLENRSESSSIDTPYLCVRAEMILASLHTNGHCVEMMEFNGSINGGIYL